METDRSRIIAFQRCPRERYLAYHHLGTGIQRIRKSLPLQFGSAFHEGAALLLENGHHANVIDPAVSLALDFLQKQFSNSPIAFDGETPHGVGAVAYGQAEQMALAEALLRAWWAYEGEAFLRTFEVVEVEQEGRADLVEGTLHRANCAWRLGGDFTCDCGGPPDSLTLMFRPDALVRDRESGDLYVVSWKTAATFGKRNTDQARHDMQSISEVWGVEQTFGDPPHDHCVEGVLYKWIIKGRRSLDKWDGLYKQNSHLIYGWTNLESLKTDFPEWSWSYEWQDEEGKTKRLGKGWTKKPIWSHYAGGVKAWIEGLAKGEIFPRGVDALAEVFPQAMPVERHQKDVEHWKAQVIAQETRVVGSVEMLNSLENWEGIEKRLDQTFPQHTHSCHSFSGCPFIPICWEGVKAEPGELYQIRTQNHPESGGDDE